MLKQIQKAPVGMIEMWNKTLKKKKIKIKEKCLHCSESILNIWIIGENQMDH